MRTVQGLLDRYPSAGYGTVLFVSEGTYEENLVVTQSHAGLTLRGAGRTRTIIDGRQRGSCLIAAPWPIGHIEHIGFENGMGMDHGGAITMGSSSLTIVDCFFAANTVGFTVNAIFPGRLGELVRPLYLARKENIKKGFCFGTIVVERTFDTFTMCFFLGVFLLARPLFTSRFQAVERKLEAKGVAFGEATLEQMDALWDEAKAEERARKGRSA